MRLFFVAGTEKAKQKKKDIAFFTTAEKSLLFVREKKKSVLPVCLLFPVPFDGAPAVDRGNLRGGSRVEFPLPNSVQ